jgi:hypothetical protein
MQPGPVTIGGATWRVLAVGLGGAVGMVAGGLVVVALIISPSDASRRLQPSRRRPAPHRGKH